MYVKRIKALASCCEVNTDQYHWIAGVRAAVFHGKARRPAFVFLTLVVVAEVWLACEYGLGHERRDGAWSRSSAAVPQPTPRPDATDSLVDEAQRQAVPSGGDPGSEVDIGESSSDGGGDPPVRASADRLLLELDRGEFAEPRLILQLTLAALEESSDNRRVVRKDASTCVRLETSSGADDIVVVTDSGFQYDLAIYQEREVRFDGEAQGHSFVYFKGDPCVEVSVRSYMGLLGGEPIVFPRNSKALERVTQPLFLSSDFSALRQQILEQAH